LSHRNAKYYRLDLIKQQVLSKTDKLPAPLRILEGLQKDLQLKEFPRQIDCFDNSNLQGSNPVAACVVFKDGNPAKREYRHYNIKSVEGPNDFASMEEIVWRRYKRQLEENQPLPQLIVVDGGKGQLSSAVNALEKLNLRGSISIIGIAKRLEEIYFPDDQIPVYLDKKSESLRIIQQLRDEAHRFGITFHRQKRSGSFIKNELQSIHGVGESTTKKLIQRFRSVKNVQNLSLSELSEEIGTSKAEKVWNHFHSAPDLAK